MATRAPNLGATSGMPWPVGETRVVESHADPYAAEVLRQIDADNSMLLKRQQTLLDKRNEVVISAGMGTSKNHHNYKSSSSTHHHHHHLDHQQLGEGFAPYKRLNEDILRYIFSLCAEEVVFPLMFKPFALSLSQVCSAWRRVALGTAELWSDVGVSDMSGRAGEDAAQQYMGAREWLARVGERPLSFTLFFYRKSGPGFESLMKAFVLPFRMRKLRLAVSDQQLRWLLAQLTEVCVEDLEELMLSCCLAVREPLMVELFPGGRCLFPRLKSITVSNYSREVKSIPPEGFGCLPWDRLCYIHVDIPLPLSLIVRSLRESVCLESCSLHVAVNDLDTAGQSVSTLQTDIYLPHLQSLALEFRTENVDLGRILSLLVLPKLRTLRLYGSMHWDHDAYSYMTLRSSCRWLQDIHVAMTSNQVPIDRLLEDTPSLRYVQANVAFNESALDGLATGLLGTCLEMIEGLQFEQDVERILTMVEARLVNANNTAAAPMVDQVHLDGHGQVERVGEEADAVTSVAAAAVGAKRIAPIRHVKFRYRQNDAGKYAERISALHKQGVEFTISRLSMW
ncbi:hypothetical protein AMATHDRAFT_69974 [Amanita thiersii Skay4041]|uniref:Uncharacterized protein n=1 Tax=Amanita thiersii Skay4041 TaxID=703135 RepID=A0A2A9NDT2_9AGAR|nr:hypothetical protein AMATHDRAFT_69974 [Amanita thiersii Skay4041]